MTQILQAEVLHDLHGSWAFKSSADINHTMSVEVKIKADALNVQQCSQKFTSEQITCFSFSYKIANEQIYLGDRKVGNLYPYSLLVYDSNTQVTEMLKLELRKLNQMQYTYSYTNMDGDALFQKAQLDKIE